jgi:inorganic pyrophosphatase
MKSTSQFKAHPWHGISPGDKAPALVTAFIEIVPTDTVKYEIDKGSGYLKIDRPQRYSNRCPMLYGFIPQSYCGTNVGTLCAEKSGRAVIQGDGDPLDILVITEQQIPRGDIIVNAIPIGGIRMIDADQADDKIIAVLAEDAAFGEWRSISQCPARLIDRLRHYFLTYKEVPGEQSKRRVELHGVYDAAEAQEVIKRSISDYNLEIRSP